MNNLCCERPSAREAYAGLHLGGPASKTPYKLLKNFSEDKHDRPPCPLQVPEVQRNTQVHGVQLSPHITPHTNHTDRACYGYARQLAPLHLHHAGMCALRLAGRASTQRSNGLLGY